MQMNKANGLKLRTTVRGEISPNVKVLCAVGDFGNGTFNLPQKLDSSSNAQLTTSAPIAQNTCYGLPFQGNALGGLCKTHN